jgi:hypothetical protein
VNRRTTSLLAVVLIVAGIVGAFALFQPRHTGEHSFWHAIVMVGHGASHVTHAHIRDVQIAEGVSTQGVQRDVGLLLRLLQLVMFAAWLPSLMLLGLGLRARDDREVDVLGALGAICAGTINIAIAWPLTHIALGTVLLTASGLAAIGVGFVALAHQVE